MVVRDPGQPMAGRHGSQRGVGGTHRTGGPAEAWEASLCGFRLSGGVGHGYIPGGLGIKVRFVSVSYLTVT